MNLELERFIENQTEMLGNLIITDSIDSQTLTDICEEYHKRKLKLLGIANVVGQSEQLKAFLTWLEKEGGSPFIDKDALIDDWLKSL